VRIVVIIAILFAVVAVVALTACVTKLDRSHRWLWDEPSITGPK
jgi:hypothetical protein